ncbi:MULTISPECIES: methyltransferase family protein [Bacteria]|jgi:protein-S-isoprenylcysteine O-methyltransferase Ste14|uniref:Isoprenylcysteine carboxylmethyltransferase family protein n=1 Tax=Pseudomonas knackmussii TaxID=65741 RepID=A0ABY4KQ81_9PSED|nr:MULTISPECIES: isoprenylcysteine carboxylmethyltransferase family protein [Bacteria]MCB2426206.1 isoprenylcysteine carboxylmethyltransferase family protein [Methylophaga pinxianii]MDO8886791.1 isoprenylcysteine carboxylmethyltransferase family protein [Candidatus Oleimmundimicrobium sp.]UPH47292.1 isoprenylcysteine carboxylmethyltransferase family protein [Methylophaga pinxianii]UPQ81397.1 isoprenylcysteine carboxylmethyltransferase family protein [Pseudomonas knackmussii]
MHGESAYGLWSLVLINSAIFIFFAFSFVKPQSQLDWRSLGAFSAFIVALFTEMYGFPLSIYFLSGWLAEKYPGVDFLSHDNGHLLHTLLGLDGNPHFDPLHLASNILIVLGFFMLASAWSVLHKAQQNRQLANSGWYARCRHPQYLAFIVIMFGFLLQWPTIPTLIMFPVLLVVYVRLAKREEQRALEEFGEHYRDYQGRVPAWLPSLKPQLLKEGL